MGKKLPLGRQDFRSIIEGGYRYIDKTQHIHCIATGGKCFFLSKPRRFGESITIATLQELYQGSKELFRGLWIEDHWDWSRKYPVIRISFTGIGFAESGLSKALHYQLGRLKPIAILFQTGYLTIQAKDGNGLIQLDYPTKEVRDSMLEVLIEA